MFWGHCCRDRPTDRDRNRERETEREETDRERETETDRQTEKQMCLEAVRDILAGIFVSLFGTGFIITFRNQLLH